MDKNKDIKEVYTILFPLYTLILNSIISETELYEKNIGVLVGIKLLFK
jgi:hypothetical protein